MSKTKKIWLGIFTFLPIIGFIFYILFFVLVFFNASQHAGSSDEFETTFFAGFGLAIVSLIISILSGLGIMIYYIVHAIQNKEFDSNKQLMWILILILASGIGNIIYYIVVIYPDKTAVQLSHN